jgi:hypothetical protein
MGLLNGGGMMVSISCAGARARARRARFLLGVLLAFAAACSEPRTLVGMSVTWGAHYDPPAGIPISLISFAYYSDGTAEDITTAADWASSDTSVITVTNTGYQVSATFVGPGQAVLTASWHGMSDSVTVTHASP